jgi:hypothetical protein
MNAKILSLLFVLLMISPVYAAFETDPAEIEMGVKTTPREQIGLPYAIERLIMLIPREMLMFVRENIHACLFPFLPFSSTSLLYFWQFSRPNRRNFIHPACLYNSCMCLALQPQPQHL